MCRGTESQTKRAIGRRFLFTTDSNGWTTITRRPSRQVRKAPPPTDPRRFSRVRKPNPSTLLSLLPPLYTVVRGDGTPPSSARPPLQNPSAHPPKLPVRAFSSVVATLRPSSLHYKASFKEVLLHSKPSSKSTMAAPNHTDRRASRRPVTPDQWEEGPLPSSRNRGNRTHAAWKGRCFKCLELGHSQATCPASHRACPTCRQSGHHAKACPLLKQLPQNQIDPLQPYGNLGEDLMPQDRPLSLATFVPQTSNSYRDLKILQKAVVVDARLWGDNHTPQIITASIQSACKDLLFKLSHMSEARYWLQLPEDANRSQFLAEIAPKLDKYGLVLYPWSPRIDARPIEFPFKVWLDLYKIPIHAWNTEHLIPLVSNVGLLLDHTPFHRVKDLNVLRVVLAVPSLKAIPKSLDLTIRGLELHVRVKVAGWAPEITSIKPPTDPTPPQEHFEQVRQKCAHLPKEPEVRNSTLNKSDFDVVFGMWQNMEEGHNRQSLQAILSESQFWKEKGLGESSNVSQQVVLHQPMQNTIAPDFGNQNASVPMREPGLPKQPTPQLGSVQTSVLANQPIQDLFSPSPKKFEALTKRVQWVARQDISSRHIPAIDNCREELHVNFASARKRLFHQNEQQSDTQQPTESQHLAVPTEQPVRDPTKGKAPMEHAANSSPSRQEGKKQRQKRSVGKTKKEIKERIAKAGLARCLDEDITRPQFLTDSEGIALDNLCGILTTQADNLEEQHVSTPTAQGPTDVEFDSSECILAGLSKWLPTDSDSEASHEE